MCGIAGQVRDDGAAVEAPLLHAMCDALEHRGPDSRGVHRAEGVGLAIQRLRVIDLDTGDQPIYNEDRTLAVVLNGEIYNYRELREDLRARGHTFSTQGDTEVIVHLYEEEGPRCVERLHGMFAFALYDARERQLMLARDRVGKKPLFYSEREGCLSFASELRALIRDHEISREIDHQAMDSFLAYQYVPGPRTAFRAVSKLPPGSTLIRRDGRSKVERYWRLDYSRKLTAADGPELERELLDQITRAVRRRMVADVPLGAFLSGGVDSSAVVAAMAEASSEPVKTFSIGFEDEAFNELPSARLIADRYATDHHEFVVEPNAVELIPRIVRHHGEPFADSSAIPTFYLSEMTRRHVTVALNGDGGDESFAGYVRHTANALAGRLDHLPGPLRRGASAAARRLPLQRSPRTNWNRAVRLARGLGADPAERYRAYVSHFKDDERRALYTREYADLVGASGAPEVIAAPWREASGASVVDKVLQVDVETYLADDLLVKADIATMAHSLEGRSPFLDHELMEFAAALPPELKLRGMERKVLLRRALRAWLPDEILDRPKMGFGVPLGAWFRGELAGYVTDVLLDPAATRRGYFDPAQVRDLIDRHVTGAEDASSRLWTLLMHEWWHREFVDQPAYAAMVDR
jgi:asparagine synthase (glutamine-hydrolysing)